MNFSIGGQTLQTCKVKTVNDTFIPFFTYCDFNQKISPSLITVNNIVF